MAVEGINISLSEVSKSASTIKTLNSNLNDKLLEVKDSMNSLKDSWKSQAATTIQNNFDAMATKYFEQYKEVIDSYVNFLENTVVQNYSTTETTINNNASQFE